MNLSARAIVFCSISAVSSFAIAAESAKTKSMDCYKIGYRFSKCALATAAGLNCPDDWDFAVPQRCQGTRELKRGIDEGNEDFFAAARKIVK